MDIMQEAVARWKTKVQKEAVDEMQILLEKRAKAKLVLDNIDREIQEKQLELNAKCDAFMSCEFSGISSEGD